jgi:hypothetical protein
MASLEEYVDHYVSRLSGPDADNAWHSLVEGGPAALPHLLNAFASANDTELRVRLIRIICQYRFGDAVPFLTAQLENRVAEIWKTALDGLVMIGSKQALESLGTALSSVTPDKREWVEEAIQQIHEANQ